MQPNPGSCTHPASAEQRVLLSSQHNVSLQLWKQGWFVVDVVVVVPCDQSRGQGSDVAKSAHHLSVLWLACISFFLNVFSSQNLSLSFVRSLQNQAVPNSLFELIFSENYHCLSFLFTASQRSVVSHCNSCTQWITWSLRATAVTLACCSLTDGLCRIYSWWAKVRPLCIALPSAKGQLKLPWVRPARDERPAAALAPMCTLQGDF